MMLNGKVLFVVIAVSLGCGGTVIRCRINNISTEPGWAVDCSSLNLASLPSEIAAGPVRNLILTNNSIESLQQVHNWTRDLSYIDLSYNKIRILTKDTFKGLPALRYLNLSNNGIVEIHEDAFEELPELEALDLSDNLYIGQISPDLFSALRVPLRRSLKQLYLHNIDLSAIPKEFFRQSSNLEDLILSRNHLNTLPDFPPSLKLLNLNHNSLKRISNEPFKNSYRLRVLLIEYNLGLKNLEEGILSNASKLTVLSLKGSKALEYLPLNFFNHTKTLKMVSLAECNFKTLPSHYKKAMEEMALIELYGNPWVCNSSIKWFPWLNTPIKQDANLRCAVPENVTVSEFFGSKFEHQLIRYVTYCTFLVIFFCLLVAVFAGYRAEMRRKAKIHPYKPLDALPQQLSNPVYVSTTFI